MTNATTEGAVELISGFETLPDGKTRASGPLIVRKSGDLRYLQCILHNPGRGGTLHAYASGALIDSAELTGGEQNAAVDVAAVPVGGLIEIRVVGEGGGAVSAFEVDRIWLSASWGRGQRKRLKCYMPFEHINVFADRTVAPCCARQWLKPGTIAGNADDQSLPAMWNGDVYQAMRRNFLNGDYDGSCRSDVCPVLQPSALPIGTEEPLYRLTDATIAAVNEGRTELAQGPARMHHDIDYGCNLACTMCRDAKILPNRAAVAGSKKEIAEVASMGSLADLSMSGAGEIFVMRDIIDLLASETLAEAGVEISVTTNASNFNEAMWKRISHNRFNVFCISADGCSSAIYDSVRRGGRWSVIERNMRFAAQLRRAGHFRFLSWNYTVQRQSVADVGKAILLARELGFDMIRLIAQLGTLAGTGGNMFEDHDLEALDALYDQIDGVGGFADPLVLHQELRLEGRRYRSVATQLEVAEYVFDRLGDTAAVAMQHRTPEWRKCAAAVERALAARGEASPGDALLTDRHLDFLRRFAGIAISRTPWQTHARNAVRTVLRRPGAPRLLLRNADRKIAAEARRIAALG